jgi:hypothetical protein
VLELLKTDEPWQTRTCRLRASTTSVRNLSLFAEVYKHGDGVFCGGLGAMHCIVDRVSGL